MPPSPPESLPLAGSLLSSIPWARTLRALASLLLSPEAAASRVPGLLESEGGKSLPPRPPPLNTPALLPSQLLAPSGQLFHLELHWACLLCYRGKLEGSTPSTESLSFIQPSSDPKAPILPKPLKSIRTEQPTKKTRAEWACRAPALRSILPGAVI